MGKINLEKIAERYTPTLDEYVMPLAGMLKYASRTPPLHLQNDFSEEEKIIAYAYIRTQGTKLKLINLAEIFLTAGILEYLQ